MEPKKKFIKSTVQRDEAEEWSFLRKYYIGLVYFGYGSTTQLLSMAKISQFCQFETWLF